MLKVGLGIIFGMLLSSRGTQYLLWNTYYDFYIADPIKQKLGMEDDNTVETIVETDIKVVNLSWESLVPETDVKQDGWFDVELFAKYAEIFGVLETQFVDENKIIFEDMQENALKWFVDAIWDPYTSYLDVKENTAFDEAIQGTQNFEWIWAVVTKKKDGVMIEEVLKNSPAFKAWLQSLDLVLRIWEESVQELDLFEAVQKIRWPWWTEVTLTIFREKTEEILEIIVTRDVIDVPSVSWDLKTYSGSNLLYLEIATFGEDTADKLQEVIESYSIESIQWVILDLRGNGWGILPIAVDVASYFMPKWDIVSKVTYSIYPEETLISQWFGNLEWIPLVVLVDGLSASASEIIAWAFSDSLGAPLIGTETFGKWSVQTIKNLSDGSSLKFSVGKWFTPNWTNVSEDGLDPDIEVEFDRELFLSDGVDTQLEKAKEELFDLLK